MATGLAVMALLPGGAGAAEGQQAFEAGVAHFRDGDFRQALWAFDRARELGVSSPSLHHNRGVTLYRLGLLEQARQAFQELATHPAEAALAHYNLGLVAQKRGRLFLAYSHFRTAYRLASPGQLRRLAGRQLALAGDSRSPSPWQGYFSTSAGYDSNVLRLSDSELQGISGQADTFVEALGVVSYRAAGDARNGLQLQATAYALRFRDTPSARQGFYQAGATWDRPLGRWRTEWRLTAGAVTLAGEHLEDLYTLEAEARRRLADHWDLALSQEVTQVSATGAYDYLTGQRLRSEAAGEYSAAGFSTELAYRFEHNDRGSRSYNNADNEAVFARYSSQRHRLRLDADYRPARGWQLEGSASYRYSRYAEPWEIGDSSQRRIDHRYRFQAEASRRLPWWGLWGVAGYTRTRTDSSLDGSAFSGASGDLDYEYRADVVRLGLEASF